jgi:hypothetical protein
MKLNFDMSVHLGVMLDNFFDVIQFPYLILRYGIDQSCIFAPNCGYPEHSAQLLSQYQGDYKSRLQMLCRLR